MFTTMNTTIYYELPIILALKLNGLILLKEKVKFGLFDLSVRIILLGDKRTVDKIKFIFLSKELLPSLTSILHVFFHVIMSLTSKNISDTP